VKGRTTNWQSLWSNAAPDNVAFSVASLRGREVPFDVAFLRLGTASSWAA
jgi:hypothetical protein